MECTLYAQKYSVQEYVVLKAPVYLREKYAPPCENTL